MQAKEVVLRVAGQARVRRGIRPVAEALNGSHDAVIYRRILGLHVLFPPRKGLFRGVEQRLVGGGAVGKGNDVGVERGDLAEGARGGGDGAEDTEALVGVLVAVAPGTPEDALAKVVGEARGGGEDVADARGEDDLAGGVDDGLVVGIGAGDGEVGVVALRLDLGDCAVGHGDGAVVADGLAGGPAVVGGLLAWVG